MIKRILIPTAAAFFAVAGTAHADSFTNTQMDKYISVACEDTAGSKDNQKLCASMGFNFQDLVEDKDAVYARWTEATNKSDEVCAYMASGLDYYASFSSKKALWIEDATPDQMNEVVANTTGACQAVSQKLEEMRNKSVKFAEERSRAASQDIGSMLFAGVVDRANAGPSAGNNDTE